jgi:hypothetical protein
MFAEKLPAVKQAGYNLRPPWQTKLKGTHGRSGGHPVLHSSHVTARNDGGMPRRPPPCQVTFSPSNLNLLALTQGNEQADTSAENYGSVPVAQHHSLAWKFTA